MIESCRFQQREYVPSDLLSSRRSLSSPTEKGASVLWRGYKTRHLHCWRPVQSLLSRMTRGRRPSMPTTVVALSSSQKFISFVCWMRLTCKYGRGSLIGYECAYECVAQIHRHEKGQVRKFSQFFLLRFIVLFHCSLLRIVGKQICSTMTCQR